MKRFAVAVLVACTCLTLAGCGVAVPDVIGKTVSQAKGAIVAAGFRVGAVNYDEKSVGTPGSVISQMPKSGTTAKPGSVVALTVAGPAPVPVPALLGLDKAKAEAALARIGLTLGAATESYDASAPAGAVTSQTPTVGANAPKGSAVAVVISKGPEPVAVQQVEGKMQAEGTALLEAAGLKVKVVEKGDKAKRGTVIAQAPASGLAQPGATVIITVSTGVVAPRTLNADSKVTLDGTVTQGKFTSESLDAVNGWMTVALLNLSDPVNVTADENGFGPAKAVTRMQLGTDTDVATFVATYRNHQVRITGRIMYGFNQNHFTDVLLFVDSVNKL